MEPPARQGDDVNDDAGDARDDRDHEPDLPLLEEAISLVLEQNLVGFGQVPERNPRLQVMDLVEVLVEQAGEELRDRAWPSVSRHLNVEFTKIYKWIMFE